jgi:uncharacterized protein YqjF (DUF2071 family)
MNRPFLQAHWSNVAIISYAVPESVLLPYLPRGCELDTLRGLPHVSVVAFDFEDTRVRGFHIPFHVDFPEINLRFYVRHKGQRGVCFIREFVPRSLVSLVARTIYNEPYQTLCMSSTAKRVADGTHFEHNFRVDGHRQRITVAVTQQAPHLLDPASDEAWFKEHEWGFGTDRAGHTLKYRVAHPTWLTWRVAWHRVHMDFARTYGPQWAFLGEQEPTNVLVAEGSGVTVFEGTKVA